RAARGARGRHHVARMSRQEAPEIHVHGVDRIPAIDLRLPGAGTMDRAQWNGVRELAMETQIGPGAVLRMLPGALAVEHYRDGERAVARDNPGWRGWHA